MKIKYILALILIVIIIFIIYTLNIDKKIYYVNINNQIEEEKTYNDYLYDYLKKNKKLEKYVDFSSNDYRITDLINDINDNKTKKIRKKEQTIQNALIKADILTLNIGNNELNYKIKTTDINEMFEYCDELINDIEKLFELIRLYDKEEIYFLSLTNNDSAYYDEIYKYLNFKIEDLANVYNIKFIKVNNMEKEKSQIYKKIIDN